MEVWFVTLCQLLRINLVKFCLDVDIKQGFRIYVSESLVVSFSDIVLLKNRIIFNFKCNIVYYIIHFKYLLYLIF
jgi:hypothetical protein